MIIGRLKISYDRGVATNQPKDLGLDNEPSMTEDGGVVRGLGTHFRSETDRLNSVVCAREERRIREEFRRAFLSSPIPGTFVLPSRGAGRNLLRNMEIRDDVTVFCSEYDLTSDDERDAGEVKEWADRIKAQLKKVPLGRGKTAGAEGLRILTKLAESPVFGEDTANRVREMIAAARLETIDRVELRRRIATLDMEVSPAALSPRRSPVKQTVSVEDEVDAALSPRRRKA